MPEHHLAPIGRDPAPAGARQWGPWWHDVKSGTLVYAPNGYYVDLDRCATRRQLADWLLHLDEKSWFNTEARTGFLIAVREIA